MKKVKNFSKKIKKFEKNEKLGKNEKENFLKNFFAEFFEFPAIFKHARAGPSARALVDSFAWALCLLRARLVALAQCTSYSEPERQPSIGQILRIRLIAPGRNSNRNSLNKKLLGTIETFELMICERHIYYKIFDHQKKLHKLFI